jgi:sRNA-binding regulator protein Hfq
MSGPWLPPLPLSYVPPATPDGPSKSAPGQKKRKNYGPESEMWDALKGTRVHIRLLDGDLCWGVLAWVDVFTIAVDLDSFLAGKRLDYAASRVNPPRRRMIYKHAISDVGESRSQVPEEDPEGRHTIPLDSDVRRP